MVFDGMWVVLQDAFLLRGEDSVCAVDVEPHDQGLQLPLQEVCPPSAGTQGKGGGSCLPSLSCSAVHPSCAFVKWFADSVGIF